MTAKRRPRTIRRHTRAEARALRRELAPAERKLWKQLRLRQILGVKFRRQQPIGRFVVDFFCPAANLVIEIDGDSHAEREEYDVSRTHWLQQEGCRVVRFVNADVHHRLDLVLNRIAEECERAVTRGEQTEEETEHPSP